MKTITIHQAASEGYSVGADSYEKGRPGYPPEVLEFLEKELGLSSRSRVLELAAGTGKFTEVLARSGAEIDCVEPVEAMRLKLAKKVAGVRVLEGVAERIPASDATYDLVVVATAFHWFDGPRALQEIHRVLRPGGALLLLWNIRDDSNDWVKELTHIMEPHRGSAPRYSNYSWKESFAPASSVSRLFTTLQEHVLRHEHIGPPAMMIARVLSVSFIAALPEDARKQVEAQVSELLSTHPETRSREEIHLPYRTEYFWCFRR